MARAGTLPDFLYEKDIVPGESVDLTGDVGLPDEYVTSSSAEEEETEDQVGEGSVRVATLDGEANFLLGRAHMSNTLDQIPVDKTWSPTESSRKMKPEVQ